MLVFNGWSFEVKCTILFCQIRLYYVLLAGGVVEILAG